MDKNERRNKLFEELRKHGLSREEAHNLKTLSISEIKQRTNIKLPLELDEFTFEELQARKDEITEGMRFKQKHKFSLPAYERHVRECFDNIGNEEKAEEYLKRFGTDMESMYDAIWEENNYILSFVSAKYLPYTLRDLNFRHTTPITPLKFDPENLYFVV